MGVERAQGLIGVEVVASRPKVKAKERGES